jgi:hypothetical protein
MPFQESVAATEKRLAAGSFWQQDYRKTRMEGLRWSLQLTNRTLSAIDAVKLYFQESQDAGGYSHHPAYSIGTDMFINTDKVKDILSDRGIAVLLGMNYHELAHVIYTSFDVNAIRTSISTQGRVVRGNFEDVYNILEEGRVEALLGARYPRMEKYFTLAVADFVVGASRPETYLLVYGRRYLPKNIRQMYRHRYVDSMGEDSALKAEKLIDEYRTVLYPGDMKRAAMIISDLCEMYPEKTGGSKPHHGSVTGTAGNKKVAQDRNRAEHDREKAKQREDDDDGARVSDSADGERAADEADVPPGGSGGEGSQGEGPQSSDHDSGKLGGDDDARRQHGGGGGRPGDRGPSAPAGGSTAGTGHGNGKPPSIKDVQNALDELVSEIVQDAAVQEDIQTSRESMGDTRNGLHSSAPVHRARNADLYPVTDAMRQRSARYAEELRRIWLAMDPGWTYGASEGRLDMNRVFAATTDEEMESVYASWDEGKQHSAKATGVIVADESYSMNYQVVDGNGKQAGRRDLVSAKNIWEIKNACREVEIQLAVVMYDTDHRLLYDLDEEVDPDRFAYPCNGGGTAPRGAVVEARRILSQTDDPGKFLIVLSDGEWNNDKETVDSLASLGDVTKAAGLIGYRSNQPWSYEKSFDIVRRSSGDMFGLMSEVVTTIMARNLEGW